MVDCLHVVIKIICAEFEIMVMMETFFSQRHEQHFCWKHKLDFEKMTVMYTSLFLQTLCIFMIKSLIFYELWL